MGRDYSELFIHETDRAALSALKAVPGFNVVMKKYMEVYDENVLRVENMSTNIRISEKQMPKYHAMLADVCKKLRIDMPDFYMKSDVNPDAYIVGDTKPTVVITSGLFETFPDELIPTVIAMQCGHIVCHHTFYSTLAYDMNKGMLFGVSKYFSISEIAVDAVNAALMYWARCSEISADRVAVMYDGSADKTIECNMRFAGFSNIIRDEVSVREFLNQGQDYDELVKDSRWKKALEVSMYLFNSHPIYTLRANEAKKWAEQDDFSKILKLYEDERITDIPLLYDSNEYIGDDYQEAVEEFQNMGFENIDSFRMLETVGGIKEGQVLDVLVNDESFEKTDWAKNTDRITVRYYLPLTEQEEIAAHRDQHRMPAASSRYYSENHEDVVAELRKAGFTNITVTAKENEKRNLFVQDGDVISITVDGRDRFDKGEWVNETAEIVVVYNKLIKKQ